MATQEGDQHRDFIQDAGIVLSEEEKLRLDQEYIKKGIAPYEAALRKSGLWVALTDLARTVLDRDGFPRICEVYIFEEVDGVNKGKKYTHQSPDILIPHNSEVIPVLEQKVVNTENAVARYIQRTIRTGNLPINGYGINLSWFFSDKKLEVSSEVGEEEGVLYGMNLVTRYLFEDDTIELVKTPDPNGILTRLKDINMTKRPPVFSP